MLEWIVERNQESSVNPTGFDTFKAFSDLEGVFKRDQAEAIVEVLRSSGSKDGLATKEDVVFSEQRVISRLDAKLAKFDTKLAEMELRIIKMTVGSMAALIALLKTLEHFFNI